VLHFLSDLAQTVGSYSSLNSARSAISLISVNAIGDQPLVKRFCKGVSRATSFDTTGEISHIKSYMLKPSRPRYDFIWDPSPVVSKLIALFPSR